MVLWRICRIGLCGVTVAVGVSPGLLILRNPPKRRLNGAVALTGCCQVATPPRRPPQSANPLYSLKYHASVVLPVSLMRQIRAFRYFWPEKEARIVARLWKVRHASLVAREEGVSFSKVWRLADE